VGLSALADLTPGFLLSIFPHRMIFIRHGETAYNAEGRLQGQRDIALNDVGRTQAVAVGKLLKERCFDAVQALDEAGQFRASPLVRVRETLELARDALGLDPLHYTVEPQLIEISFGRWEGLLLDQVDQVSPGATARRNQDKWDFTPPGGESYAMLAARLTPWLQAQTGDRFVAAHGGVARAFLALIAGMAPEDAANADIRQGAALLFENNAFSWIGA